jgi:hypothetical protein
MSLPLLKSFDLLQNQWKSILDPIVANPIVQGAQLTGIQLNAGQNTVPHKLGRTQQGWIITDIGAVSSIFRTGDFNASNMVLTASAACTVAIWVY